MRRTCRVPLVVHLSLGGMTCILPSQWETLSWRCAVPDLHSQIPGTWVHPSTHLMLGYKNHLGWSWENQYQVSTIQDQVNTQLTKAWYASNTQCWISPTNPVMLNITNSLQLSPLAEGCCPPWSVGHNRDSFPSWKEVLQREKEKRICFVTSELKPLYFPKSNHL